MRKLLRCLGSAVLALAPSLLLAGPIVDTVVYGGEEWAQPDLFTSLSWDEINAVCPGGVCSNNTLNGQSMAGWTWAGYSDIARLYNHFLIASGINGDQLLSESGYDNIYTGFTPFTFLFFDEAGFRPTRAFIDPFFDPYGARRVDAFFRDPFTVVSGPNSSSTFNVVSLLESGDTTTGNAADGTTGNIQFVNYFVYDNDIRNSGVGAWFYRNTNSVPLPASSFIFLLALSMLLAALVPARFRRSIRRSRPNL